MSPGRTRGPAAGCAAPQAGLAPARPGTKVKAGNKPAGISAQQPATPVPAGTGKVWGAAGPPCLGQAQTELLPAKGGPGMLLS